MTTELDFVNKRITIKGSLGRQISYLQKADIEDLTLGDLTTRIQKLRELEMQMQMQIVVFIMHNYCTKVENLKVVLQFIFTKRKFNEDSLWFELIDII